MALASNDLPLRHTFPVMRNEFVVRASFACSMPHQDYSKLTVLRVIFFFFKIRLTVRLNSSKSLAKVPTVSLKTFSLIHCISGVSFHFRAQVSSGQSGIHQLCGYRDTELKYFMQFGQKHPHRRDRCYQEGQRVSVFIEKRHPGHSDTWRVILLKVTKIFSKRILTKRALRELKYAAATQ